MFFLIVIILIAMGITVYVASKCGITYICVNSFDDPIAPSAEETEKVLAKSNQKDAETIKELYENLNFIKSNSKNGRRMLDEFEKKGIVRFLYNTILPYFSLALLVYKTFGSKFITILVLIITAAIQILLTRWRDISGTVKEEQVERAYQHDPEYRSAADYISFWNKELERTSGLRARDNFVADIISKYNRVKLLPAITLVLAVIFVII